MTEIRKLTAREAAPVRVKINLTDDNWVWVMDSSAPHPKLISEDGAFFIVQYSTRLEYEAGLELFCGMVGSIEEVSIT